jgi:hypothetical protein
MGRLLLVAHPRISSKQVHNRALQTANMSNTAKRLLEIMNKFSSPSKNARKVDNDINSILKIPALTQNQKRFSEEDLVNRVNPYGRPLIPQAKSQSPISLISKPLQISTMSQLLQLKRLQASTETIISRPMNFTWL